MKSLFTLIEKLKLNSKLILGFSSGLLIAALVGYQSLTALTEMEGEMEQHYERETLGISHIKEANINLVYIGRALRNAMLAQDEMTRDKARAQIELARATLRNELEEGRKRIFRAEVIAKYDDFLQHFARYNENVTHALAMLERERLHASDAAKFMTSPEFAATVNAADDALTAMTRMKERGSSERMELLKQRSTETRREVFLLLGMGLIFAIAFGILIGLSIKRPSEQLTASVEDLANGKVDETIPHTDYPNEIGILARAIKVLQDIYRRSNEQHWIKSHAGEIATVLQQADDFKTLAQSAVSKLAPLIGAGHAALYVADRDEHFNLLASYGYRERKHLNSGFALGEGLVGQCAMEKAAILLTAPKDYIRINSGLGEGPPACIMVLPIMHGERVLGVMEVASFQPFAEREKAILEALLPVIGTNMEILDRNLRTRELLASTQEQAIRMEKQAAQLEEQTVEMEAQQAELLETENWFRSIIEAAPEGMLVTDEEGQTLLANPMADKIFGYGTGALIGTSINQVVPDKYAFDGHGSKTNICAIRKDGSEFRIDTSFSQLPQRGNRGKCASIAIREVTA